MLSVDERLYVKPTDEVSVGLTRVVASLDDLVLDIPEVRSPSGFHKNNPSLLFAGHIYSCNEFLLAVAKLRPPSLECICRKR